MGCFRGVPTCVEHITQYGDVGRRAPIGRCGGLRFVKLLTRGVSSVTHRDTQRAESAWISEGSRHPRPAAVVDRLTQRPDSHKEGCEVEARTYKEMGRGSNSTISRCTAQTCQEMELRSFSGRILRTRNSVGMACSTRPRVHVCSYRTRENTSNRAAKTVGPSNQLICGTRTQDCAKRWPAAEANGLSTPTPSAVEGATRA